MSKPGTPGTSSLSPHGAGESPPLAILRWQGLQVCVQCGSRGLTAVNASLVKVRLPDKLSSVDLSYVHPVNGRMPETLKPSPFFAMVFRDHPWYVW